MLGAGVETSLVSVPVHNIFLPVRSVVVVAASHHGDVLLTDPPELSLSHHVDLVLCAVHHVVLRDGCSVQPSHLQYLVVGLVTVLCWRMVDRFRSVITSSIMTGPALSSSLVTEHGWSEC